MEILAGCFFLFVIGCIACALFVGALLFVFGTIILLTKIIIWMAYLGACFLVLGVIGCALAKLFKRR